MIYETQIRDFSLYEIWLNIVVVNIIASSIIYLPYVSCAHFFSVGEDNLKTYFLFLNKKRIRVTHNGLLHKHFLLAFSFIKYYCTFVTEKLYSYKEIDYVI